MASQDEPIYLISVNNTPDVAKRLVAILINEVKEHYKIVHVANADALINFEYLLSSLVHEPQLLICSSQWTRAEQEDIRRTAENMLPNIKTIEIPPRLNAAKGGEAVVAFLKDALLGLGLSQRA